MTVTDVVQTNETTTIDAEILRSLAEGDAAAWHAVVRRYGGVVTAAVRSFRLQDADRLDAVQMTWLRLAENAHRIRKPEHLGGWLKTTARREVLAILRRDARQQPVPADVLIPNAVDPAAGPEQRVIQRETERILQDLVADLPPLRRRLLRALFNEDPSSYQEIARTVGIPSGGIGPTRARILRHLRCRFDELELSGSAPGR